MYNRYSCGVYDYVIFFWPIQSKYFRYVCIRSFLSLMGLSDSVIMQCNVIIPRFQLLVIQEWLDLWYQQWKTFPWFIHFGCICIWVKACWYSSRSLWAYLFEYPERQDISFCSSVHWEFSWYVFLVRDFEIDFCCDFCMTWIFVVTFVWHGTLMNLHSSHLYCCYFLECRFLCYICFEGILLFYFLVIISPFCLACTSPMVAFTTHSTFSTKSWVLITSSVSSSTFHIPLDPLYDIYKGSSRGDDILCEPYLLHVVYWCLMIFYYLRGFFQHVLFCANKSVWISVLTSYLGLWDEQLSPPGGRGSCEVRKEEKEGWPLFRGIFSRQVAHVNSKIKYIFILFLPGPYLS